MDLIYTDIDQYIRKYRESPGDRQALVKGLIDNTNRLFLNFPTYGIAREISGRLKDGPFSDFYEFERKLASTLHPFLSRLYLNIYSDYLINKHFEKRYAPYKSGIEPLLKSKGRLTLRQLKSPVIEMAGNDGHFMVIKFCDIILRNTNKGLAQTLRSIEHGILNIKIKLGGDDEKNRAQVAAALKNFTGKHDEQRGKMFLIRASWDKTVRKYLPGPADSEEHPGLSELLNDETFLKETAEAAAEEKRDDRVTEYARMIKERFLDTKNDDDIDGIREMVDAMFQKNIALNDREKAEEIVQGVLGIFIDDPSISPAKKKILHDILNEIGVTDSLSEEELPAPDTSPVRTDPSDGEVVHLSADDLTPLEDENADREIRAAADFEGNITAGDIPDPADEIAEFADADMLNDNLTASIDDILSSGQAGFDIADREETASNGFDIADAIEPEDKSFDTADTEKAGGKSLDIAEPFPADSDVADLEPSGDRQESDEKWSRSDSAKVLVELERIIQDDTDSDTPHPADNESAPYGADIESAPPLKAGTETGVFEFSGGEGTDNESAEPSPTDAEAPLMAAVTPETIRAKEGEGLRKKLETIDESDDDMEKTGRLFRILPEAVFEEHAFQIIERIPEKESLISELMGHLYQVSKTLTPSEMKIYIDSLIEEFKKDKIIIKEHPHLLNMLENYRDSIEEEPHDLLSEIYAKLSEIKNKADDAESGRAKQSEYLNHCIAEKRFSPVKRRLIIILENILTGEEAENSVHAPEETAVPEEIIQKVKGATGRSPGQFAKDLSSGAIGEKKSRITEAAKRIAEGGEALELESIMDAPDIPDEAKSEFNRINSSQEFNEAFNYITGNAGFNYETKILLLDRWLRKKAEKEGWLETGRNTKLAKIERMINSYKSLIQQAEQKSRREAARREKADRLSEKKEAGSAGGERDNEEKISQQASSIIRAFADYIEFAEPLLKDVARMVPEKRRDDTLSAISSLKKQNSAIINGTIKMIENKEADPDLIEKIYNSSPMVQYIWSRKISGRYKDKKLAEIFNDFEGNKEIDKKIKRIVKVIQLNNKDDLLKKTLSRERELIETISRDLSPGHLKKLWSSVKNSRTKEKVRLFKDFLELAAPEAPPEIEKQKEKTANDPPGVKLIKDELINFQKLYGVPETRTEAEKRIPVVDRFLVALSEGDNSAVGYVKNHKPEFARFLRFIINKHPELREAFQIPPAVKYCKEQGLL